MMHATRWTRTWRQQLQSQLDFGGAADHVAAGASWCLSCADLLTQGHVGDFHEERAFGVVTEWPFLKVKADPCQGLLPIPGGIHTRQSLRYADADADAVSSIFASRSCPLLADHFSPTCGWSCCGFHEQV